ncbi:hypothetical protein ACEPAF_8163 [Sanghuangporus sanghuang]
MNVSDLLNPMQTFGTPPTAKVPSAHQFSLPPCVAEPRNISDMFLIDSHGFIHLPSPFWSIPRKRRNCLPPTTEFLFDRHGPTIKPSSKYQNFEALHHSSQPPYGKDRHRFDFDIRSREADQQAYGDTEFPDEVLDMYSNTMTISSRTLCQSDEGPKMHHCYSVADKDCPFASAERTKGMRDPRSVDGLYEIL